MAEISVDREIEGESGWRFEVDIRPNARDGAASGPATVDPAAARPEPVDRRPQPGGTPSLPAWIAMPEESPLNTAAAEAYVERPRAVTVLLSWADYDLWSDGLTAPQDVVRNVVTFLLSRRPAEAVPAKFDAATVRRWYPDADEVIRDLSRPSAC